MKKILSAVILSAIYFVAPCQPCASYFFEPKKIEWLRYNTRGIQDGTLLYTISAQSLKNNPANATVNVQLYDRNKKLLNTGNYSVKCLGQYVSVDMRFFIPAQQVEQYMSPTAKMKMSFLEYPLHLKAGDQLKDGFFQMENDKNGLKQILQMKIVQRTVTGMEPVTTAAGTWNCFVITSLLRLNLQTGPISIPLSMQMTEWYAPSFGIVKTSSAEGYAEINSVN